MAFLYALLAICCTLTSVFMLYLSSVYSKGNQFPQTIVAFSLAVTTFVSGVILMSLAFG
jgi:hypothetical protein